MYDLSGKKMEIISTIAEYRAFRNAIPNNKKIGFVPTMGALHEGHGSLVMQSVAENDLTIVSVFVNPTQFGPKEDLGKYPRMLLKDAELVQSLGANVVFAPNPEEIYPVFPSQIVFSLRDLDKKLCGASRPGHFNGVVQVVSLLFHIIQPDNAYFGEKDFQQLMILKQLVKEQHFHVNIQGCPIIREKEGLAMSSRNLYLSPEEREEALILSQILFFIKDNIARFSSVEEIKSFVYEQITHKERMKLDYFEVLEEDALREIEDFKKAEKPHAFIAAFCGKTRLIDNLALFS